jgi:predicted AlkP superfamily phosphohydrolase/phosphomutase
MNHKRKVIVLGIDGGTFDIIQPLINQGRLPNLGKICRNGSSGELASTFPPMTFPAWSTFMTGVNPGKHGVFDFTEHVRGRYAIKFTSPASRKAETIWKRISDAGLRTASIGFPLTYPPEPVNGIMISGFDTPLGGYADATVFHPSALHREIHDICKGYNVSADVAHALDSNRPELAYENIVTTLNKKIQAALHVFQKEAWDCFMVLFGETDLASHHFWKYHDPTSPFHEEGRSGKLKNAISSIYEMVDEAVGRFLALMDDQTTMLIMSDHGFGGNSNRAIYINRWLEKNGLLSFLPEKRHKKIFDDIKNIAIKYLPHSVKVQLFRKAAGMANVTESMIRFSGIDWSRTLAYSEETPYFPTIWLNLEGREPQGIVPQQDYEQILSRVMSCMGNFIDPETGQPVFENIYRRDMLYSGDYVQKAADILMEPAMLNGHYYLPRHSKSVAKNVCFENFSYETGRNSVFQNKTGSHRRQGIFMGYGYPFEAGASLQNARIVDIAPTVLSLLGLAVPDIYDGQVLSEKLAFERISHNISSDRPEKGYSDSEEAILEKRMRDLGYMD